MTVPEVEDFFTRLIMRVAPKSYAQANGEVVVTRRFLENFSGESLTLDVMARPTARSVRWNRRSPKRDGHTAEFEDCCSDMLERGYRFLGAWYAAVIYLPCAQH